MTFLDSWYDNLDDLETALRGMSAPDLIEFAYHCAGKAAQLAGMYYYYNINKNNCQEALRTACSIAKSSEDGGIYWYVYDAIDAAMRTSVAHEILDREECVASCIEAVVNCGSILEDEDEAISLLAKLLGWLKARAGAKPIKLWEEETYGDDPYPCQKVYFFEHEGVTYGPYSSPKERQELIDWSGWL